MGDGQIFQTQIFHLEAGKGEPLAGIPAFTLPRQYPAILRHTWDETPPIRE